MVNMSYDMIARMQHGNIVFLYISNRKHFPSNASLIDRALLHKNNFEITKCFRTNRII